MSSTCLVCETRLQVWRSRLKSSQSLRPRSGRLQRHIVGAQSQDPPSEPRSPIGAQSTDPSAADSVVPQKLRTPASHLAFRFWNLARLEAPTLKLRKTCSSDDTEESCAHAGVRVFRVRAEAEEEELGPEVRNWLIAAEARCVARSSDPIALRNFGILANEELSGTHGCSGPRKPVKNKEMLLFTFVQQSSLAGSLNNLWRQP